MGGNVGFVSSGTRFALAFVFLFPGGRPPDPQVRFSFGGLRVSSLPPPEGGKPKRGAGLLKPCLPLK
jgi:hypothetical protein